jgi:hypothetical protein
MESKAKPNIAKHRQRGQKIQEYESITGNTDTFRLLQYQPLPLSLHIFGILFYTSPVSVVIVYGNVIFDIKCLYKQTEPGKKSGPDKNVQHGRGNRRSISSPTHWFGLS